MSEEEEEENILEIEIKNFANYLMDFGLLMLQVIRIFVKSLMK